MPALPSPRFSKTNWHRVVQIASLIVIVVSLFVFARLFPVEEWTQDLMTFVEGLGISGALLFGGVYVVATMLFVPGTALTLVAGALFGLFGGTVIVSIAATVAAGASFLLARYLAGELVYEWAGRNQKARAVDEVIAGESGWKIVALLRLSPIVPFGLCNYTLGVTSIRFWPCLIVSGLAMVPGTFMYVYLGYTGRVGLDAAAGAGKYSGTEWLLLILGLVATIGLTVYITVLARRVLRRHSEPPAAQAEPAGASPAKWRVTLPLVILAVFCIALTVFAYLNRREIEQHLASSCGSIHPPGATDDRAAKVSSENVASFFHLGGRGQFASFKNAKEVPKGWE